MAGRNEDPGGGLGQGRGRTQLQDERRYRSHGRHESCGQHGRQEPCHHDREEHLNLLREQRRSDRERAGRDVGFSDHKTSESRASRTRRTAVLRTRSVIGRICRAPGNPHLVISTQHSEHLKTVRNKEVAGYSGPGAD